MTNTVECQTHGEQEETYVCQHLARSLNTQEHVGFFWANEPRGDAGCSECEAVRVKEGGISGDWNDRSEELAGITLICGACYDKVRALNGL